MVGIPGHASVCLAIALSASWNWKAIAGAFSALVVQRLPLDRIE